MSIFLGKKREQTRWECKPGKETCRSLGVFNVGYGALCGAYRMVVVIFSVKKSMFSCISTGIWSNKLLCIDSGFMIGLCRWLWGRLVSYSCVRRLRQILNLSNELAKLWWAKTGRLGGAFAVALGRFSNLRCKILSRTLAECSFLRQWRFLCLRTRNHLVGRLLSHHVDLSIWPLLKERIYLPWMWVVRPVSAPSDASRPIFNFCLFGVGLRTQIQRSFSVLPLSLIIR